MQIEFHRSFQKRYRKAPLKMRRQFDERLFLFIKDPFLSMLNNHPLTGDHVGQWSINVTGDWRAIYVFRGQDTIIFIDLDTHSNLYR